jgi:putative PEP-CTERM system histidine kinase
LNLILPISSLIALAAGVTVVLTFLRDRRAPGHFSFAWGILLHAFEIQMAGLIADTTSASDAAFWRSWILLSQALQPVCWLHFSLRFARDKSTRLHRWVFLLAGVFLLPLAVLFLLPDALLNKPEHFPAGWKYGIRFGGFIIYTTLLVASALSLMNLERTVRAAIGTMRWRIKFIIIGVAVLLVAKLYTSAQVLIASAHSSYVDIVNAAALLIACPLLIVGTLRPGSFGVKVYPSERVLQFSVTGLFLGGYLVVVGIASKFLSTRGIPALDGLKALLLLLSLAGLGILILSERARDGLKRLISRHFRRPFYDYRTVWLSFTEKSASILDPDSFAQATVSWVSENLHVLSVSIWLFNEDATEVSLAASTGFSNLNMVNDRSLAGALPSLAERLKAQAQPFDVDRFNEPWAAPLRRFYADQFTRAGNRVCAPLISRGRLLGVITLGDRVNDIAMGEEEFDLLKCVGDQVASTLLNIQLSQRLIQAKEMEAFQTIAAFFVHDLKNTASTLNLTLQNLPRHWENAEFRSDALRAISKSVGHINDLISRLTLFRQRLELHPQPVDLNQLLRSCVAGFPGDVRLETSFAPLQVLRADPSQLEKVFVNLLLNAREALRDNGAIQLETRQENGWASVSVSDNGCGMSPDFMSRCLFRPFQTTKKGGIGIGMFQSKAIIEAHGGKIEVESQVHKGTTFTVLLPTERAV